LLERGPASRKQLLFIKKGTCPGPYPEDQSEIRVWIPTDRKVDGQIGKAKFAGCRARDNRDRFGRKLNTNTDYIIHGAVLEGRALPEDTEARRPFAIPFDIVDGRLKGGLMVLKRWKDHGPCSRDCCPRRGQRKRNALTGDLGDIFLKLSHALADKDNEVVWLWV
jgi:hypothetical protein